MMRQLRQHPLETCILRASDHIERRLLGWFSAAAWTLAVCQLSWAASVTVGTHALLPNTANQVITIQITGGDQVAGEDFFAQIGDGGAFLGGTDAKPAFTNVDILSSTIFSTSNNGSYGDPNGTPPGSNSAHPLIWVDGTTTVDGSVPAVGLLATLTIDTTGLNSGTFPLLLTGVASSLGPFDTTLRDANGDAIPLSVSNGTLIVMLAGDYNQNGVVDAADYTTWRDLLGTNNALPNRDPANSGLIDEDDFLSWRNHFGETSVPGAGSGSAAAPVPEPGSVLLAISALIGLAVLRQAGMTTTSR
jgi:hypothetical protein